MPEGHDDSGQPDAQGGVGIHARADVVELAQILNAEGEVGHGFGRRRDTDSRRYSLNQLFKVLVSGDDDAFFPPCPLQDLEIFHSGVNVRHPKHIIPMFH